MQNRATTPCTSPYAAIRFDDPDRAVAATCTANNFAVVIPCCRVVRTDDALSRYAWGAERKHILLDREAQHAESKQVLLPAIFVMRANQITS